MPKAELTAIGVLPCNSAPGQPHATNPLTKKGHNSQTTHRNKRGSNWTSSRIENGQKPRKTRCSHRGDEKSRGRQHRGAERQPACCRRRGAVGRRLAARWRRARVCRTHKTVLCARAATPPMPRCITGTTQGPDASSPSSCSCGVQNWLRTRRPKSVKTRPSTRAKL